MKRKREVLALCFKYDVDILGILETKIKRRRKSTTCNSFKERWTTISNSSTIDPREGDSIGVDWNPLAWDSEVLKISTQIIHIKFSNTSNLQFHVSFVYYKNDPNIRKKKPRRIYVG